MEFKVQKNDFSILIENKIYHIYESYIINGTGYTFAIYKSSKKCQRRENYYIIGLNFNEIVIIGKKYNYMLIRNENKFEFDVIKYNKNILRCVSTTTSHSIYLNDEKILSFYGSNKLFEEDMKICENIVRKQKLIKINNE